ncbi:MULTISPECIES: PLP-dependent transferase [Clostridia]|uniref:PLP-dependent transferase n=1 Tax=Clostridia TaxID=186801 RepID=UPI000EA11374|nr:MULTISPECIES: PLP-dependent transferase [Clostridia]NBJ70630.1 methionine biosynthesis PLP-dependent protein [Roseburia sp. 1XD42-34]RKI76629.1 methionine biosynthesis PLP-dependent protein [Clostridium sp. 1xD42-85]
MTERCRQETFVTQIGNRKDEAFHAVSTPVYFSTAFRHTEISSNEGYDYSRCGSPTRDVLEEAVAQLEYGDKAFATASGMAAVQLVFSLFHKNTHFISSRDIYGGNYRLFAMLQDKYGFEFTYWDGDCYDTLASSITENTQAIFIESPTNPLMKTVDLVKVSNIAKQHGLLLIVDNTLYTPLIQQPIKEGADIVIHSATKYLAGHNDVLAGLVISKGERLSEQLVFLHQSIGAVLSPFDCFNLIRGIKTLAIRMEKHEANAKQIVPYLQQHPLVTDVYYPGRGGMVSFEILDEVYVTPFLKAVQLFTFAESLGGVESFITYPVTQTHMDIPEKIRNAYGLSNRLLRISVGIEHANDLIADLNQAFDLIVKEEVKPT